MAVISVSSGFSRAGLKRRGRAVFDLDQVARLPATPTIATRGLARPEPGECKPVKEALRLKRCPEYADLPPPVLHGGALRRISPQPSPDGVVLPRIAPEIISVLDYSKGFADMCTGGQVKRACRQILRLKREAKFARAQAALETILKATAAADQHRA
jgi:hypothetical protein